MMRTAPFIFLLAISSFLLSGCVDDNSDSYTRSDREYELEERAGRLQQELDVREQELQDRQEAIESAREELDSGEYSDAYDSLDGY